MSFRVSKRGEPIMNIFPKTIRGAGVAILAGLITFFASRYSFAGESYFWAFIVTVATATFLLVKPEMVLGDKIKRIGLWDILAPCVLMVIVTIRTPQDLPANGLRLVFAIVFFVGIGTALRLIFRVGKGG